MVDKKGSQQPARKPPIPHSKYKPSAAKRQKAAFTQLCTVLAKEWHSIRCLNLGVRSGTGVIEDVLYSQLQQLADTVHFLAVSDAEASQVLVQQACRLSTQQFQQLQELLDVLNLEELSDFLKLMCAQHQQHRSSSCGGGGSASAGGKRPATGSAYSDAAASSTTGRLASAVLRSSDVDSSSAGRALSSRQRRLRAAAGVFDLSQVGYADSADPTTSGWQQLDTLQHLGSAGAAAGGSALPDTAHAGLKFAHLLPPGHILVKTAEALQQQQQFQAALAAATPRPARQRTAAAAVVPPLRLHQQGLLPEDGVLASWCYKTPSPPGSSSSQRSSSRQPGAGGPGGGAVYHVLCSRFDEQPAATHGSLHVPGTFFLSSGGGREQQLGLYHHQQKQQQQQQSPLFKAPGMSVEQLWKAGRAATTAAVLAAAHLPVRDSPGDALSLVLADGLVLQQQQLLVNRSTQASTPEAAGASGSVGSRSKLASRRGSTANSRPNSARNRPSRALLPLQLQRVDAGGADARGMCSSRPGSAAATSRLGPAYAAGSTAL